MRHFSALLLVAAVGLVAVPAAQSVPDAIDAARLRQQAAALPRLHSLLVSRRGELLFEYYARGHSARRLANVKSVSKSIISALVGIAIDRGLIRSVREPIATFFPELRRDPDPRKQKITIEDLLTMRAALETTSNRNYGAWVQSRNWVRHVLAQPVVADPGTTMIYSTGSTHLLSAILTRVSGTSTWQFAQAALFEPLGLRLARWTRDPQGIYFGGNEMALTPPQMVAFGELYRNGGRASGRQIVPERWVETSCEPRTISRFDAGREYGYGWWIDEVGGEEACYAWGYGGQYIFVFEDLDLVVAATSSTAVGDERRGYRRQLLALIAREVIQPLAQGGSRSD